MPKFDLVRAFTLTRPDGTRVDYAAGNVEVAPEDAEHWMVKALSVKPGERLQVTGGVGTVTADPTPSAEQGEVAPVGQEPTGKIAVPSGGGAAPKAESKDDPRPAPPTLTGGGSATVAKKV